MNEIFSFSKELTIKKILIVVAIAAVITFLVFHIIFSSFNNKNENIIEDENPIATFSSTDNRFSIEFPKEYGFVSYSTSGDKLLELRNDKNLNVFVSSKDLISNKSLSDIVSADITSYLEEFSNSSNISEITEFVHNEKPAFTYSFHYLDFETKTTYYLQVMWLEYVNNYYIIDVEFPLDDLYDNTSIINDILNNFKVN